MGELKFNLSTVDIITVVESREEKKYWIEFNINCHKEKLLFFQLQVEPIQLQVMLNYPGRKRNLFTFKVNVNLTSCEDDNNYDYDGVD